MPEPDPRPQAKADRAERRSALAVEPTDGLRVSSALSADLRTAAASANAADTVEINSGGVSLRVLRQCVEQKQELAPKQGEAGHIAACWVVQ